MKTNAMLTPLVTPLVTLVAGMHALLLVAAALLPGVAWCWEAGVPVVKKAEYPNTSLPTGHAFFLKTRGSQERHGLAWLDNNRLMFVAALPDKELESRGIYIWDVAGNSVVKYSNHIDFCFAQGYLVAYGDTKNDSEGRLTPFSVRYGHLGSEREDICELSSGKGCPPPPSNMSCKPREYGGQPLGKDSSVLMELRSGDGAIISMVAGELPDSLEKIRKHFSKPLMLVSKRFPAGKALPVTALEEIVPWRAAYSEYSAHYVFLTQRPIDGKPGHTTTWPKSRPQPVYLMSPDGTVEAIQVPWRVEAGTIDFALPAKTGLIYKAGGSHAGDWGGLFLYDNREVWALDNGRVETFAVSPDGCRLAYAIINDFGKIKNVRFNNIKSINLCEGRK